MTRRVLFSLALCCLSQLAFADPGQNLKVLTLNFNDEVIPTDPGSALRDGRFRAFIDWAKANDPDIILFQEGWTFHSAPSVAKPIAEALGYDYSYWIGMGFP